MADFSRDDLLALKPSLFLEGGYLTPHGEPRPELADIFATAVAVQLQDGEASPQEVAATCEALKQALPLHGGDPKTRLRDALQEAFEIVGQMYNVDNNATIVEWLDDCAARVQTSRDLDALLLHTRAVSRQHALFVTLSPQQSPTP
ncbi:MAG: hypothetical protein JWR08_61 [Enterovirga sp.]|nr:hypothetical protein [Enterovirga sp.]